MQETKRCPKCETLLPRDAFASAPERRDGLRGWCRICSGRMNRERYGGEIHRQASRRWYQKNLEVNRERARVVARKRWAENPEPLYVAQRKWRERNREYMRAYTSAYWKRPENLERRRARGRESRRRRRARLEGVQVITFLPVQLKAKLSYFGHRCWVCGNDKRIEIDHVKPVSAGGGDILCNLHPICVPCNKMKADHWPCEVNELRRRIALEFVA